MQFGVLAAIRPQSVGPSTFTPQVNVRTICSGVLRTMAVANSTPAGRISAACRAAIGYECASSLVVQVYPGGIATDYWPRPASRAADNKALPNIVTERSDSEWDAMVRRSDVDSERHRLAEKSAPYP